MVNDPLGLLSAVSNIPGAGPWLVYVPVVVMVMNAVATALPPPTSKTGFYTFLYTFVNVLALSFGHAKNAASVNVGGPAALVTKAPDAVPQVVSVSANVPPKAD